MTELVRRWERVLSEQREAHQLVSSEHPLHVYYGATTRGAPEFLVQYPRRPRRPDLGSSVRVDISFRQKQGDWLMAVSLDDPDLHEQFVRLASDVIEKSGEATSATSAYEAFEAALERWKRLLRARSPFGEEALRGLVGELYVVQRLIEVGYDPRLLLDGWKRSATTPQDLYLPDGRRIEVKAIRPGGRTATIASAEQLDWPGGQVELLVVELSESSAPDSINLNELVATWAAQIDAPRRTQLTTALEDRGYTRDHPLSELRLKADASHRYGVGRDFPAIRRSALSPAIIDVSYSLALGSIQEFEMQPPFTSGDDNGKSD